MHLSLLSYLASFLALPFVTCTWLVGRLADNFSFELLYLLLAFAISVGPSGWLEVVGIAGGVLLGSSRQRL